MDAKQLHPSPVRGFATADGTHAYAARFPQFAKTMHFRKLRLPEPGEVSSLGIGTYQGKADDATDEGYAAALRAALESGINLIDTAINYRHQRSERTIGRVLAEKIVDREQVFVCTKGGFIPFDGEAPADPKRYVMERFVRPGLIQPGQLAGDAQRGMHCMAPVFLAYEIQQSLENLGLECLDVFYLHNPEFEQAELSREEFHRRLQAAFAMLEKQAEQGRIRSYGVATWNGLRVLPDEAGYLDLNQMVLTARELAGEAHHFRFVQLPYNLAMPEAYALQNQVVDKPPYVSTLNSAFRLGLHAIGSSSLKNGELCELGEEGRELVRKFLPPAESDAELALHFVRSTAGLTAGLVGMSNPAHVAPNLRAAAAVPALPSQIGKLLLQ